MRRKDQHFYPRTRSQSYRHNCSGLHHLQSRNSATPIRNHRTHSFPGQTACPKSSYSGYSRGKHTQTYRRDYSHTRTFLPMVSTYSDSGSRGYCRTVHRGKKKKKPLTETSYFPTNTLFLQKTLPCPGFPCLIQKNPILSIDLKEKKC